MLNYSGMQTHCQATTAKAAAIQQPLLSNGPWQELKTATGENCFFCVVSGEML
jgi:hypothetical protein